jgi:single-stranded-DNA-specific exonuclease
MEIVRRVVPLASIALAAAGVNPVLARVFASRGVASADELDLDLSTLPGFATMKGIAVPRRASPTRYSAARRS